MHRRAVPSSFSSAFTRSMGLGGVWCTPATSLKPVLRSPCGSNHLAVPLLSTLLYTCRGAMEAYTMASLVALL